jgi:diguanylate cyclase (GGDEF)-like protein
MFNTSKVEINYFEGKMFKLFDKYRDELKPVFHDFYKIIMSDQQLSGFFDKEKKPNEILDMQLDHFCKVGGMRPSELRNFYKDLGKKHAEMGLTYSVFEGATDYLFRNILRLVVKKDSSLISPLEGFFEIMECSAAYGYLEYHIESFTGKLRKLSKYASDTKSLKDFIEWFLMLHSAIVNKDVDMFSVLEDDMPKIDFFASSAPDLSEELAGTVKDFENHIKVLFFNIERDDAKRTLSSYTQLKEAFFTMLYLLSILEQKTMEESFSKDPLTGALTRKQMNNIIDRCSAEASDAFTVALTDIDHFKKVNDTYGHDAGDIVLKEFTRILMKHTKDEGGIVIRYGGEEFLVVLQGKGASEAEDVLENVRLIVEMTPFNIGNRMIHITSSFGMAEYKSSNGRVNALDLVKAADENLYKAKEGGRNRIVG